MARPPALRLVCTLMAAWFMFSMIQPAFAEPCPHHQPALVLLASLRGGETGGRERAHAMSAAEMSAGEMAQHGTSSHGHSGPHGATHRCTCVGVCGITGLSVFPGATLAFAPPHLVAGTTAPRLTRTARLPHQPAAHFLPDATAPPPIHAA